MEEISEYSCAVSCLKECQIEKIHTDLAIDRCRKYVSHLNALLFINNQKILDNENSYANVLHVIKTLEHELILLSRK